MFPIPEYLNKSVVSLLVVMLEVDPLKRATIEDIKGHDWLKKELPAYLFPQPNEADASSIDMDAVKEICQKFAVCERDVNSALLSGDPHDQLSIAYHLIVDNKRIEDETSKLDILDFYVSSSPPPNNVNHNIPHIESPSGFRPRRMSGNAKDFGKDAKSPMKRAKWHLGIRSQSKPLDIMNEVFRAMKALDFVSANTLILSGHFGTF